MFEQQQELEKAQGYRGPATRFFGPLDSVSDASHVLREMCISLLLVAALLLATSFRAGWLAAGAAALIAIPAALLLILRKRSAAIGLLIAVASVATGLLVLGTIRGIVALVFWVAVLQIAGRASRATFKLHEFAGNSVAGSNAGA